ncbi:MAG: single-stranded DNA-binding protein [Ruminiclostridium sp.]|nr:single-stranded DNA-binding protein [Ruminiclostridium sp.]
MFNKVIMLGRVTQDLELKTTQSGVAVLSFSIAVDRRFQTKGEEKKSDFFNCVAWRQEAEFISRYWTKGRPILVEGELQNRSYVDKNGATRYITEIIVDRASFTGDKKPEGGGGGYRPDTGYPEPPPASSGYGSNSAPSSPNGGYTADDFKNPPAGSGKGDIGDYPF